MSGLTLVSAGKSSSTIVLHGNVSQAERNVALDLQATLREISGATLPISESAPASGACILIGRNSQTEKLLPSFDWSSLKEDGCIVRTTDNSLVLAGATPRGTVYAIYEFLESQLGCRWLTPRAKTIPKRSTVEAGSLDLLQIPKFRYREPYFRANFEQTWACRNKVNGSFYPIDQAHGGKLGYAGFVHTFYPLVPPEKHFKDHPEYFSEINGRRTGEQGQLCLTNPHVVDVTVEAVRRLLADTPDARIVSVSQNDTNGQCTCRNCRALDEREGSSSGALIAFVNAVAERLETDYPNVLVDTLAYMYSVEPPRNIKPRHNVVIRLCHLNGPCDSHPLEKCEMNSRYLEQLRGWTQISPEVFIWDYFSNFANYFMPYPNLDALCADIPLYARSGVTGIFCQCDGGPSKGPGDMGELRAYLLAKLLWKPESDGRKIIDEFVSLYYGAASEPIREYLDVLHAPARCGQVHISPYMTVPVARERHLTDEVMDKAEKLMDAAAEKAAGDSELSARVKAARLPIEFIRWNGSLAFARKGRKYIAKDPVLLKRARRFFFDAMAAGTQGLNEQSGRPIRKELTELEGDNLIEIELEGLRLFIAPKFGGRILGLLDPVTGRDWMHQAQICEPGFPIIGGYEEYSQSTWRSAGWREPFVADVDERSVRLSALLPSLLVMERTYRLERSASGSPCLVIESTISNSDLQPRDMMLRLHPHFAAGPWKSMSMRIARTDGSWYEWAPWQNAKAADECKWLEAGEKPAGKWALQAGARQLVIEFQPERVDKFLPSFERRTKSIYMDMYGHPLTLQTQESHTIRQVWTPENS